MKRLNERGNDGHRRLGAGDFPGSHDVRLTFEDGSVATFYHATLMEAPELGEIGVFTEHLRASHFSDGGHAHKAFPEASPKKRRGADETSFLPVGSSSP